MQLEAKNLRFGYDHGPLVLNDVSLSVKAGERVALVGPSGYGKSTLAKILSGYLLPSGGHVLLDGKPFPAKGYCPVQLVYQHPEKALNPRWKLRDSLIEGYAPDDELLCLMGIEHDWLERWPNELSGGELQRFCIARVLGEKTRFLIADEISAMLDVITQAQIWDYLLRTVDQRKMGLLVVTHNQALADRICTRIIDLTKINHLPLP